MSRLSTIAILAAALVALPSLAFAEDLVFQLTNSSSYSVTNFFTSPATTDNWEEDVLGQATLEPGTSVQVTIADGSTQCNYDMKFVPEGAPDLIVNGVDLCTLSGGEYTLTDAK